jgi:hypothetical protein
MIPHIILIMQDKYFNSIDWVDDLCVCEREKGSVKIFPSLEAAVSYKDRHDIDGKVVELPVY